VISYNEITASPTVDHNKQKDVALQRGTGGALTMSDQQAYHKRPVLLVSHLIHICVCVALTWSDLHERRNVGTGTQRRGIVRNMQGCTMY
jgi:hypothetical protein